MRARLDAAGEDLLLAVALLVGLALQAVLIPMSSSDRLVTVLAGGAVCASVAVRRRFPRGLAGAADSPTVINGSSPPATKTTQRQSSRH